MLIAVGAAAKGRSYATMAASDIDEGYNYDATHYLYYNDNSSDTVYNDHHKCGLSIDSNAGVAAVHYIPLVLFPLLLLQGIVGNILAIPVLISISRSAWSTVIYLACLAATDLIILLIRCGSTWYFEAVRVNVSKKIIDSSDAACKAYYFSFMCVQHINPWLVVAVSVDLMIATRWPRRTYIMCTLERARYVLLLMGLLVVCLDINHFWTFGVPKPGLPCMYTEEFSDIFKDFIWPALDNAIGTVVPLAVVAICFSITAKALLLRSPTLFVEQESEMKKYFLELATFKDFKIICFIICLIFILISVFKISYILTTILDSLAYIDVDCVTRELFNTLDMTFTFLFYGAKIYLYVALSPVFREKLKLGFFKTMRKTEFFCRKICKCGHNWTAVAQRDNCHGIRNHSRDDFNTADDFSLQHADRAKPADQISQTNRASYSNTCDSSGANGVCSRSWNQTSSGNKQDLRTSDDVKITGSVTNV